MGGVMDGLGVVALALSAVLLVAGASKLFSPHSLAQSMMVLLDGRIRRRTARTVARTIGILELAAAVLVSVPITARYAAVLGVAIGVGIVGWVGVAAWRRVTVACGCFGGNSATPLGATNAEAGVLITGGFALLLLSPPGWGLSPGAQLNLVALLALSVVLTLRFGEYAGPIRKGLGAWR